MTITAATLEAALAELDADSLDHLGFLMRERAAQLRAMPPAPRPPESIVVPAASIWAWVAEDMLAKGQDPRTVVEVVGDLAVEVDHLPPADVEAMLVDVLRHAEGAAA